MGVIIKPEDYKPKIFNPAVGVNAKMSTDEFVRELAREQATSLTEDVAVANNRAKHFCKRLFTGKVNVQCKKCSKNFKFKNDRLRCPDCGTDCDFVEYIEDYVDRSVKTTINVKNRAYYLQTNDPE